jgi:adenosine deaminase CECR1
LRQKITQQPTYYDNAWDAQPFITVKNQIMNTQLYNVLKLMPKGAILHLHSDSMGDFELLLKLAATYISPNGYKQFYVSLDDTIDPREYFKLFVVNDIIPKNYTPLSNVLLDQELWTNILGKITLTIDMLHTDGSMWKFFGPIFARIATLLSVETITYQYYKSAFQYLLEEDHVCHVELRTQWRLENQEIENTKEYIILKALHDANNASDCLSLRVIFYDSRHISNYDVISDNIKYVAQSMANNDEKTNYLVGYDMVSEEDTGQTTHKCVPIMIENLISKSGRIYPTFYLHDGETNLPPGRGTNPDEIPVQVRTNDNLIDAYLINTMACDRSIIKTGRVGHAIGLYKNIGLMNRYIAAKLPVELCPISNQLLHYVPSIKDHPGQTYLSSGLPCSLSPDDPAIFGYQGVTFDFWEACVAWNLSLKALKVLAYYSIQYSALDDLTKEKKITQWLKEWYAFISQMMKQFDV